MSLLRLAIPSPLRQYFDYLPPEGVDTAGLEPGARLRVPFGNRELVAYLVEQVPESATTVSPGRLKRAISVLDQSSLLPPALVKLSLWCARYYHHPIGEVVSATFPTALRKGKMPQVPGQWMWQLTREGKGLPEGALKRSPRQALAITLLQQAKDGLSSVELQQQDISGAILSTLAGKQLIAKFWQDSPAQAYSGVEGLQLSAEQQAAVEQVTDEPDAFCCHLLEGVTGSGKTEVYLQLIDRCLRSGRQALVLIPEIGLTPQTEARFRQRFGERVAVSHSGLGEAARAETWSRARAGQADIILGTRSAVFTPLARPGLIVVDEEHDGAYKQQDGFRYHARDVAVKRGQLEQVPVVLGSATPSLESLHNALGGRYRHYRLHSRAGGGQMPALCSEDIRRKPLSSGFGETLLERINHTLEQNNQVLLFVNRRGFAASLRCGDCGWIANCDHCDARMTPHRSDNSLQCHHCGHRQQLPTSCPVCGSNELLGVGLGTEQVEMFLRKQFPETPVHRVDSDTVGSRDAMCRVLKPGGRLLVLEFSKPESQALSRLYDGYSFNVLPFLGRLVTNDAGSYRYLAESIRVHPDQETLKDMILDAGFDQCEYYNMTGGIVALHKATRL